MAPMPSQWLQILKPMAPIRASEDSVDAGPMAPMPSQWLQCQAMAPMPSQWLQCQANGSNVKPMAPMPSLWLCVHGIGSCGLEMTTMTKFIVSGKLTFHNRVVLHRVVD